jgi:hypothetical protein
MHGALDYIFHATLRRCPQASWASYEWPLQSQEGSTIGLALMHYILVTSTELTIIYSTFGTQPPCYIEGLGLLEYQ